MVIAIMCMSLAIGFFFGHIIGYRRCSMQYKLTLKAMQIWVDKEMSKNKKGD